MDGRQLRPFRATSSAEISPPGRSPIVLLSVPTCGQRYGGLHGQKTRGIRPPAGQEAGPWRDTEPPATPAPGTAGVSQSMWLGRLPGQNLIWSPRHSPVLGGRRAASQGSPRLDAQHSDFVPTKPPALIFQNLQYTKRETFVQISRILIAQVNRHCLLIFPLQ